MGGPVVASDGRVIGVITRRYGSGDSLGIAIPIAKVWALRRELARAP